jgi:small-conductance mechanosensitive channel
VRLLLQAWDANALHEWANAAVIATAVLLALIAVKYGAVRLVLALSRRTATRIDDVLAQVVAATRVWLLVPVALYAGALAVELPPRLDRFLGALAAIVALAQAALWANRLIQGFVERQIAFRRNTDGEGVTTLALLGIVSRAAVWLLAWLLILDHLGFDITALIAGLGIGGVAVALAVQNILGDLFASLSIVLDKPFVVGDFVVVGDLRGTIEHIGLKTTRVRSLDGELIVFSNADLLRSRIRNFKRMRERRILFSVGVTYETPLDKAARIPELLRAAVESTGGTRFDRAHFAAYGDFALRYEVVYYVLDPDYNVYMDAQQAINLEIFRRFADAGIAFAYPSQWVFVRQAACA